MLELETNLSPSRQTSILLLSTPPALAHQLCISGWEGGVRCGSRGGAGTWHPGLDWFTLLYFEFTNYQCSLAVSSGNPFEISYVSLIAVSLL